MLGQEEPWPGDHLVTSVPSILCQALWGRRALCPDARVKMQPEGPSQASCHQPVFLYSRVSWLNYLNLLSRC